MALSKVVDGKRGDIVFRTISAFSLGCFMRMYLLIPEHEREKFIEVLASQFAKILSELDKLGKNLSTPT
jgi:hypothetical protein